MLNNKIKRHRQTMSGKDERSGHSPRQRHDMTIYGAYGKFTRVSNNGTAGAIVFMGFEVVVDDTECRNLFCPSSPFKFSNC